MKKRHNCHIITGKDGKGLVVLVKKSKAYDAYPVYPIKAGGGLVVWVSRGNFGIEAVLSERPVRGVARLPEDARPARVMMNKIRLFSEKNPSRRTLKMKDASRKLARSLVKGAKG